MNLVKWQISKISKEVDSEIEEAAKSIGLRKYQFIIMAAVEKSRKIKRGEE